MNRRGFLTAMAAAPLAALAGAAILEAGTLAPQQAGQQPAQPSAPPGATPLPGQQPQGQWPDQPPNPLDAGFPGPNINRKAILKEDHKKMVKEVNRLYDLAGKLRKQVTKTDSSEILSLDLIHTAEKIEKLAKHIKNLARG